MAELSREQEQLLTQVLSGELPAGDARVQQACQGDPSFAARLAELIDLEGLLTEAYLEMGEVLGEAELERDAPGEDQLEAWVLGSKESRDDRSATAPRTGETAGNRPRWGAPALAAAALLLVALGVWFGQEPKAPEIWMGAENVRLLEPDTTSESELKIQWEGRVSPGGSFAVQVWTIPTDGTIDLASTESLGAPTLARTGLSKSSWTLGPGELETLGPRVLIDVTAHSSSGDPEGSARRVLDRSGNEPQR